MWARVGGEAPRGGKAARAAGQGGPTPPRGPSAFTPLARLAAARRRATRQRRPHQCGGGGPHGPHKRRRPRAGETSLPRPSSARGRRSGCPGLALPEPSWCRGGPLQPHPIDGARSVYAQRWVAVVVARHPPHPPTLAPPCPSRCAPRPSLRRRRQARRRSAISPLRLMP